LPTASLAISVKEIQIDHLHPKCFHLVKIAKIGPADPEIICFREIINKKMKKKKEINARKIYSPSGKFAERAKLTCSRIYSQNFKYAGLVIPSNYHRQRSSAALL